MEAAELIKLAIALVVIAFVVFVLRRASAKSQAQASSARERLGVEPEAAPKRVRRRPRPGQAAEPEPEPVRPDVPEVVSDEEARDAYKAGLAKTRGGFVAKIGKLFGKKKIDEATVDELEEVLFTADIGPRAADRIF